MTTMSILLKSFLYLAFIIFIFSLQIFGLEAMDGNAYTWQGYSALMGGTFLAGLLIFISLKFSKSREEYLQNKKLFISLFILTAFFITFSILISNIP